MVVIANTTTNMIVLTRMTMTANEARLFLSSGNRCKDVDSVRVDSTIVCSQQNGRTFHHSKVRIKIDGPYFWNYNCIELHSIPVPFSLNLTQVSYIRMYHIDMNSPPTASIRADPESPALPSAALGATRGARQNAYEAEPLQDFDHEKVIIASWGQYQTLDQMRASPYYSCIRLPMSSDIMSASPLFPDPSLSCESAMVSPCAADSESRDIHADHEQPEQYVTLHAVHPVPTRYLRSLAHDQLEFLFGYWTEKRIQPDGELARRMCGTMEAIGQIVHSVEDEVI